MVRLSKLTIAVALVFSVSACSEDRRGKSENPEGGTEREGTPDRPELPLSEALPIVFVHGFAGSAQQYESQAIRFAANGYPRERIFALDHDGSGVDIEGYAKLVDELVDDVLTRFDLENLNLVGHSRGTLVSNAYLGVPERAAKIARYASLDGSGCDVSDGAGVPCIAPSQAILEGQAHVEVATSPESFAMQYEFFAGKKPAVVDIVPQQGPVELRGRVVNFPANTGRAGSTLEVWEIDADTGHRAVDDALATFVIDATGEWGPITVDPEKHYEWAVAADGVTQHFYMQRYVRSSHFVRLLTGAPDSPIRKATRRGPGHATAIAMRMREWYTNPSQMGGTGLAARPRDPAKMDVLEIGTKSPAGDEAAVDITSARMTNGNIAIHIHDDAESPGRTTLGALPAFSDPSCTSCTVFQTTADVFMPASDPPSGTITFRNIPRGDASKPQILNVPNWASDRNSITVVFGDYPQ